MTEYAAKGVTVSWGGTTIGQITSFSGMALSSETLEVSDLDDTAKQYIWSGLYGADEVSVDVHFDPGAGAPSHSVCAADVLTGTTRVLIVNYAPATVTYTANAICTGLSPSGAVGDKLTATITWQPTGTVTL